MSAKLDFVKHKDKDSISIVFIPFIGFHRDKTKYTIESNIAFAFLWYSLTISWEKRINH